MRDAQKPALYAKLFLQSAQKFQSVEEKMHCSRRFLKMLARKKELHLLPKVLREAERMAREGERKRKTVVTSRFDLDETSREKIILSLKKIFSERHAERHAESADFHFQTDEKLLGGFVARCGDFLYDATVDGALAKLRRAWR